MIISTKNGLKILQSVEGQQILFIDSSRLNDCIDYLYKNKLKYITINSYQGYKLNDLNFLKQISGYIEGISIPENHYDLHIVNDLHSLKQLGIGDNGKDCIDLKNFPYLESCAASFSPRLNGLESCKNLKILSLSDFKSSNYDLSEIPKLISLEKFILIQPKILTLNGIERLKNIKVLEIFMASKLKEIKAVIKLKENLEELIIEKCKKINDFDKIEELINLKKLMISESGYMDSLNFLTNLIKLKFFSFWGTNVLDGDISNCKYIEYVGFDNKRHYSHKFQDFNKQ